MPRTGSTLLISSLQQHLNVVAYEELFHFDDRERALRHSIEYHDARIYFDAQGGDAIKFLQRYVLAAAPSEARAIGFKIFAEYVKCPGTDDLFRRLQDEIENLRVIHVVRRNYLEVLVSRALASLTGQWEARVDAMADSSGRLRHSDIRLSVDMELADEFFQRMAQADQYIHSAFSNGRYIKIEYEQLMFHFSETMNSVLNLLEQENAELKPVLIKQNVCSLPDVVRNYDRLKKVFADTEFSEFFDAVAGDDRSDKKAHTRLMVAPKSIIPKLAF
jgi:LPS sulfotransferase NodH